jgi:hypothetical protein
MARVRSGAGEGSPTRPAGTPETVSNENAGGPFLHGPKRLGSAWDTQ